MLISLLLILVTLIVFWQVLGHESVTYDDPEYVFDNPNVQHGLTLDGVKWAFTATYAANWHPLTWLSHMLDYQLYGVSPAGHHATNLLFHLANVLLLFFVLRRMTGAVWRSAFVAALFAIHPLHVESVAWIAERKDVLSTFFWMITMWAYVWYSRAPNLKRYLAVVPLFALGLMSKPMLVSLPLVLLLLDFWPLARLHLGRRLIWEKAPLAAMSMASSAITLIAQNRGGAVHSLEAYPLAVRLENAVVAYVTYLVKMIFPRGLAVLYPHPQHSLPVWETLGAALILISISALAIRTARRHPYFALGWSWYVTTLIPVIGIVQVGVQGIADRYTYVPLIGIFMAIAWGVPNLLHVREHDRPESQDEEAKRRRKEKRRPAAPPPRSGNPAEAVLVVSGCAVVFMMTICAYIQAAYWQDSITLFTHATAVTTGNYIIHSNLGQVLVKQGKLDEAIEHYAEAIRINPRTVKAHTNMGNALLDLGREDEAIQHLSQAVRLDPDFADAHYNLGNGLARKQKYKEAIEEYRIAVRINPKLAETYNNMGNAFAALGETDEALRCYLKAIQIEPRIVQAYVSLGNIEFDKNSMDEAISWYAKALEIKPDLPKVHNDLAGALYYKGGYAKAWQEIMLCRRYGGNPSPALLQMLSEKMPVPR
jgi:tetratricopeptide (TPR) repeat protein